ncbi:hypothetical protein G6F58_012931 [Rhizopus delemar]|nr:hypothetical protein G6F58_012931 [Rhizopus delemar]
MPARAPLQPTAAVQPAPAEDAQRQAQQRAEHTAAEQIEHAQARPEFVQPCRAEPMLRCVSITAGTPAAPPDLLPPPAAAHACCPCASAAHGPRARRAAFHPARSCPAR